MTEPMPSATPAQMPHADGLKVLVGCEFRFEAAAARRRDHAGRAMPASRACGCDASSGTPSPTITATSITTRIAANASRSSAGSCEIAYEAELLLTDPPTLIVPDAAETPVAELPDETLSFIMPSRFCLPDELGNDAWQRFGGVAPGWNRVQAIVDFVHDHLEWVRRFVESVDDRRGRLSSRPGRLS